MLAIREETSRQDAVAELLRQSDALAALLYPGAYRRPLDPDALAVPGIRLFVARQDGLVAGCCALFEQPDGTAELKRMIVDEAFRHQGVGMALLRAVERAAVAMDIRCVRMEVGIRNTGGQAPYRRLGYRDREPFGSYQPSSISLFLEKVL